MIDMDKNSVEKKSKRGGFRPNAGRKVGSIGANTRKRINKIDEVLEQLDEYIIDDIATLPPKLRAQFWKDLVEYRRPKLARTESEVEVKKSVIKVLDSVEEEGIKATFTLKDTPKTEDDEDLDFLNDI